MSKEIRIKFPLRAVGILVLSLLLVGAVAPLVFSTVSDDWGKDNKNEKVKWEKKKGVSAELNTPTGELLLSKWGDECKLKIKTPDPPTNHSTSGKKEKLKYEEYEVNIYELEAGMEYEIILSKKPKLLFKFSPYIFYLSVESENLEFYYHPPLNESKYPEGWTANATHVFDEKGRLHRHCPENAVGSYAVYHSSKRNNEYKAGKFGHIYRPKIIDGEGDWIWADLYYDEKLSRFEIKIDSGWLEAAKYPVTIDPSFGYDVIGVDVMRISDNILGSNFTLSVPGTATSISAAVVYDEGGPMPFAAKAAIYDTDVFPFDLIVGSVEIVVGGLYDGWKDFDIVDTPLVADDYYLVCWANGSITPDTLNVYIDYDGVDDTLFDDMAATAYNGWPDPCQLVVSMVNTVASIYCNYTLPPTTSVSETTCVTSHFTTTVTSVTTSTNEIVTTSAGTTCTSVYSTTCMSGTTTVDSTESVDVTHSVNETVTVSVDKTIYTTSVESTSTTISVTTCTSVHHTTTITSKTTTTNEVITTSSDITCTSVSSTTCMTGTTTINTYTKSIDATHSIDETVTVVVDETIYKAGPSEEWWDTDWWYRISVDITSGYGALTNYQIYLDLHVAEGTSSGHDIYMGGTAQADYDDVRVIANDQVTELKIWQVDNYTWSYPDTRFWVKVPSIPASPDVVTIWVYWGNDAVSSVSNGDNVFPFFDDFNGGADVGDWINHTDVGETSVPVVPPEVGTGRRWWLECETWSVLGSYSAVECNDLQTLVGGSPTYGWSMEWDGTFRTYDPESGTCYSDNGIMHDFIDTGGDGGEPNNDNATAVKFLDSGGPADRSVVLREWQLAPHNPLQSNSTFYEYSAWGQLGDHLRGRTPSKWSDMQITMFSDYSYFSYNGTIIRELDLIYDHTTLSQGPTFHSKSWAAVGDYLRNDVNWVLFRPIADPEPSFAMGEMEGYDVDVGILNREACGNWTFEGRTQYIFWINVTSPVGDSDLFSSGVGFFDDSGDWYSFFYNYTTEQITLVSPDDGISVGLRSVETGDGWSYVTFNVMFNPTVADSADVELYGRAVIPVFGDIGWIVGETDYFNIYNLGGYAEYSAPGPLWGRTTGGDVFDMYIKPLGGVFRANATYKNLQHVHFLVHWNVSDVWDGGNGVWNWTHFDVDTSRVTYGIDYCYNDTWIDGWECRITHTRGTAGTLGWKPNQAWVEFTVEWYNRGILIKTDKIYTLYESYLSTDSNTKVALWVDLWFNKINASTTVGGRVSAEYFGMEEKGWGPWASWSPISNGTGGGPANSQSMFFGNLQGDIGDTISCTELSMMKVWCYFEGIFCYHDQYLTEYDIFNVETEAGSMRGIDTPVFVSTKMWSMPSTGFLQSLLGGMLEGMGRLFENLWMSAFVAWSWIIEMLDVIFTHLGYPNLITTIITIANNFFTYMTTIITEGYLYSMIVQMFLIPTYIFGHAIYWLTRFLATWVTIFGIVWGIIDGTYTLTSGLGDLWVYFSFNEWVDAVPIFMIISWIVSMDSRARKGPDGYVTIVIKDVKIMTDFVSMFISLFMQIINFFIDIPYRIMRLIRG